MSSIPNSVIGALISQDLLLLANAFTGEVTNEEERLIVAIKLKLHIDMQNTTPDEILSRSKELAEFQTNYQEFILETLSSKRHLSPETLSDLIQREKHTSLMFFRQITGSILIAISLLYVIALTWFPVPTNNVRFADTSLGFLLGTVIATVINFFFGNSETSKLAIQSKPIKSESYTHQLPTYTKSPVKNQTADDLSNDTEKAN